MIRTVLASLLLAATAACASNKAPLEAKWMLDGFETPDSVALSADGKQLYVSNVAGEATVKNGEGFISLLTVDGQLVARRWAQGLDAPKGMALSEDGLLWIADVDRLNAVDASTGKLRVSHLIGQAEFLNDVAIAPDGAVLVSDSEKDVIFALKDGAHEIWLEDPRLDAVTALLPLEKELLITTSNGLLLSVAWGTKTPTVLASGLTELDGVAKRGDEYYLSEWPGRILRIKKNGEVETLLDTTETGRFQNDFVRLKRMLFVPSWLPGVVTAYRIR